MNRSTKNAIAALAALLFLFLAVAGCNLADLVDEKEADHDHDASTTTSRGLEILPGGCEALEDKRAKIIVKTDSGPVIRACDEDTGAAVYLWVGVNTPVVPAEEAGKP